MCRISQAHSLYQVWTLWDHSFLSYALDISANNALIDPVTLTFEPQNSITYSVSQGHSLYQVWTLWDHLFLSYAADKQTNKQTKRQTDKKTDSKILAMLTDIVGVDRHSWRRWLGNKQTKHCSFTMYLYMSRALWTVFGVVTQPLLGDCVFHDPLNVLASVSLLQQLPVMLVSRNVFLS